MPEGKACFPGDVRHQRVGIKGLYDDRWRLYFREDFYFTAHQSKMQYRLFYSQNRQGGMYSLDLPSLRSALRRGTSSSTGVGSRDGGAHTDLLALGWLKRQRDGSLAPVAFPLWWVILFFFPAKTPELSFRGRCRVTVGDTATIKEMFPNFRTNIVTLCQISEEN